MFAFCTTSCDSDDALRVLHSVYTTTEGEVRRILRYVASAGILYKMVNVPMSIIWAAARLSLGFAVALIIVAVTVTSVAAFRSAVVVGI